MKQNDIKYKAKKLNWPNELITKLLNLDARLLTELLNDEYSVEIVNPEDIIKITVYLGSWWKVLFGDIDIIRVKPYRKNGKTIPSTEYEVRLRPGTLVQYYVNFKFPGKELSVRKLFYCKK